MQSRLVSQKASLCFVSPATDSYTYKLQVFQVHLLAWKQDLERMFSPAKVTPHFSLSLSFPPPPGTSYFSSRCWQTYFTQKPTSVASWGAFSPVASSSSSLQYIIPGEHTFSCSYERIAFSCTSSSRKEWVSDSPPKLSSLMMSLSILAFISRWITYLCWEPFVVETSRKEVRNRLHSNPASSSSECLKKQEDNKAVSISYSFRCSSLESWDPSSLPS